MSSCQRAQGSGAHATNSQSSRAPRIPLPRFQAHECVMLVPVLADSCTNPPVSVSSDQIFHSVGVVVHSPEIDIDVDVCIPHMVIMILAYATARARRILECLPIKWEEGQKRFDCQVT